MCTSVRVVGIALVLALAATTLMGQSLALADSAAEIDRDVDAALKALYASAPSAKALAAKARGILVFPSVVKGGLIIGGQYGEGALRKGGRTVAYYNTGAASYGLQAGVQTFGQALFFMTEAALNYLENSDGWEVGIGPSIVIVDTGAARTLTTTTAQDAIYAFIFSQKGLMAGVGLQGSKITKIEHQHGAQRIALGGMDIHAPSPQFVSFTFVATGGKRHILAGVEPRIKEQLEATGMTALIGAESVFVTTAVLGEPMAQAFAAANEWTANAATTDHGRSAEVT